VEVNTMPETDTRAVTDIADRLFDAIERSDVAMVEELFSPDVAGWKIGDGRDNDGARPVRIIAWFIDATVDRRYEVLDRQVFGGGFVYEPVLQAPGHNGGVMA